MASQVSNQPSLQQPAQQPQNNNSGNNQPQNLRDDQVIGSNGEVIDLGRTSDNSSTK